MSKPRSYMFNYTAVKRRLVRGFTTEVHFGQQSKHLPGQPGYDPTRSTITLTIVEIQRLIDQKAGTGQWRKPNKEIIDFEQVVGLYREAKQANSFPTTRGVIHYSKYGCHLVPASPKE